MATQPQFNNLNNLLKDRLSSNNESINIITNESLPETQSKIDNFTPSCTGFDTRIVSLASSINNIQNDIVILHSNAYAVGCGTTVGQTELYPDTIQVKSFNISISNYDDDDPFAESTTTLTSSNVGFGTFTLYTQNNSSVSGLGIIYADIGNCYGVGCISGDCTTYLNQITAKEAELVPLRLELSSLRDSVNSLKFLRTDYEEQRWADKNTIKQLQQEIIQIGIALTNLNNPQYDSFV